METIIEFWGELSKAWDKEPETLIDLGITDEVYTRIEKYCVDAINAKDAKFIEKYDYIVVDSDNNWLASSIQPLTIAQIEKEMQEYKNDNDVQVTAYYTKKFETITL